MKRKWFTKVAEWFGWKAKRPRRTCSKRCRQSARPREECECVCGGARHGTERPRRLIDAIDEAEES